jgi:ABC-type sulfate transport system permease component
VTWLQVLGLFLVAGVLAIVARATHRALQQRREPLTPHEAVNRLVLAKSCAVAGALFVGGYLGHALSWFGVGAEHGGARIAMSLLAAAGSVLVVFFALLLERACRVKEDDEEP